MYSTCEITPEYLAAGDVNATVTLLHHLAESTKPCVRAQVAANASTPVQTLARLLSDKDGMVRSGLAENPSIPMLFLKQLAADDDDDVRYGLADNAAMPVIILDSLTSDPNPYVAHRAKKTLSRLAVERETLSKQAPLKRVPAVQAAVGKKGALLTEVA